MISYTKWPGISRFFFYYQGLVFTAFSFYPEDYGDFKMTIFTFNMCSLILFFSYDLFLNQLIFNLFAVVIVFVGQPLSFNEQFSFSLVLMKTMNILLLNVFFAAMVYLEYKFANTYLNLRNESGYLNLIKEQSKSKFLFISTTDCKIMYSSAVPVSILCSQANNLLEI